MTTVRLRASCPILTALTSFVLTALPVLASSDDTIGDLPQMTMFVFHKDDVARLRELAPLDDEQTKAVETALLAACEQMLRAQAQAVKDTDKAEEDGRIRGQSPETISELRSQAANAGFARQRLKNAEIERQALASIREILSAEQAQRAWEPFQRARRFRAARALRHSTSLRVTDPAWVLQSGPLSPDERAAIEPIVNATRDELDAPVRRALSLIKRLEAAYYADPNMPWDGQKTLPEWGDLQASSLLAQRIYASGCLKVQAAVSPETRARIERQRSQSLAILERDMYSPNSMVSDFRFSAQRQVLTIDTLSPEQRTACKALLSAARDRVLDLYREDLAAADRAAVAGEKWERSPEAHTARIASVERIRKQLRADLDSLLTPEQREEFETGWRPARDAKHWFEMKPQKDEVEDE